jgi:NADH dehydrogenase (ubiquinone) 1 beta subcomplex subunit 3
MSEGPLYHDPWAKREAWRKTPEYFSKRAMFRQAFPGFGIALVAFTVYVVVDNMYTKTHPKEEQHHH